MLDHLLEIIAAVIERRGKVLAEQRVGEERSRHDRQGRPEHAPDEHEQRRYRRDSDREVRSREMSGAGNERPVELPMIETDEEGSDADAPPEPPSERGFGVVLRQHAGGEQSEEADMYAAQNLARHPAPEPRENDERNKHRQEGNELVPGQLSADRVDDDYCRPDAEPRPSDVSEGEAETEVAVDRNAEGGDDLKRCEGNADPEEQPPRDARPEILRKANLRIVGRRGPLKRRRDDGRRQGAALSPLPLVGRWRGGTVLNAGKDAETPPHKGEGMVAPWPDPPWIASATLRPLP